MTAGIKNTLRPIATFSALLAGLTACDGAAAAPIDLSGTGHVEGLLFFDANEDKRFDPSSGDRPLPNIPIVVRDRGTTSTLAGAAVTTGANGRFTLANLPLGTHDLFINATSVPAGVSVCENPVPVTVLVGEPTFQQVATRPACLITIAQAKAAPLNSVVVVRGIVTSFPGQIESGFTYLEDATGGIFAFGSVLEGKNVDVGDLLEISGNTTIFGGQFEIVNPVLRSLTDNVSTPSPLLTTTSALAVSGADPRHDLQNRFVRVQRARLTGAFGSGGLAAQNATIDDGSGLVQIRIDDRVAPPAQLNTLLTVGRCYNINGFGVNFNGTGQLFPRSMADIQEVPCS